MFKRLNIMFEHNNNVKLSCKTRKKINSPDLPEFLHEDRSHNADQEKGSQDRVKLTGCGDFDDLNLPIISSKDCIMRAIGEFYK